MTQFEYDQLAIMARGWLIRAETTEDETVARICRANAQELLGLLRCADTTPGGAPDEEPYSLPPMRAPRVPEFTPEDL